MKEGNHHADIIFFHNFNDLFSVTNTKSEVTSVELVSRDEDVKWSKIACKYLVAATVQLVDVKLLKHEFILKWTRHSWILSIE